MTLASLHDYLPLGDLGKIVVACLLVSLAAPAAVAVAIAGLDRRSGRPRGGAGTGLAAGVLLVAALIAAGVYALFTD
jgi:hypothetical protein